MEPLQQSDLFARALRHLGQDAALQTLWNRGRPVGRMLVVARHLPLVGRISATLRGPLFDPGVTPDTQARVLRQRGPGLIEADHPLPRCGYLRVMTPATVAVIDLAPDRVARRARMQGKWRNRLVQAEHAGLILRTAPARGRLLDDLLVAEAAQRRARRYRGWPLALIRSLCAVGGADMTLHLAEHGGAPVAVMLIARHGTAATYVLGWSGDAGRAISAHHLILWDACNRLADQGVMDLDLGSVDTDGAAGLARFKIGSGAALRSLGGSWLRLPFTGRDRP
jgi:hypothetical protein